MTFKSKAQMRLFYAKAQRGEISKGKVEGWENATPNIKGLPERLKKKKGKKPSRSGGKKK